jgi:hypothetical protein
MGVSAQLTPKYVYSMFGGNNINLKIKKTCLWCFRFKCRISFNDEQAIGIGESSWDGLVDGLPEAVKLWWV